MTRSTLLTILLLSAALLLSGCFETTLNLGSAEQATADVKYCGDWHFTGDNGKEGADLVIRNFDGHRYYVEWREGNEKTKRMSGFLVTVKDATFAQLTGLEDKGEIPA